MCLLEDHNGHSLMDITTEVEERVRYLNFHFENYCTNLRSAQEKINEVPKDSITELEKRKEKHMTICDELILMVKIHLENAEKEIGKELVEIEKPRQEINNLVERIKGKVNSDLSSMMKTCDDTEETLKGRSMTVDQLTFEEYKPKKEFQKICGNLLWKELPVKFFDKMTPLKFSTHAK